MDSGETTAQLAGPADDVKGNASESCDIVLIAGTVSVPDRIGHHDYLAGCAVLARLLSYTPGVRTTVIRDGWPADEAVLARARALVIYSGGRHKLAFLRSASRIDCMQELVDRGVGLVMIHQATSFPPEFAPRAATWIGGAHVGGESDRGHWVTHHREFPSHPVTRGLEPWSIKDGWLRQIRFLEGMRGITPLVWSGPKHRGSREGGTADVVSWTYERPDGGRSFCFTGLDAHFAWSMRGVRRLLANGILWSAGLPVPEGGAPCAVDQAVLQSFLTPRGSRGAWTLKVLRRGLRRLKG